MTNNKKGNSPLTHLLSALFGVLFALCSAYSLLTGYQLTLPDPRLLLLVSGGVSLTAALLLFFPSVTLITTAVVSSVSDFFSAF